MYLDGEEERMLRAIVQAAVVAAAVGRPFAGEFHHFVVRATCLQVNEHGVAAVAVTIWHRGFALPRAHRVVSLCELASRSDA
ncbi:MAG: hypothetical protein IPH55_01210 [Betaproteobacteria bacterium]|nr:hypothetical protein [Betaproteobacteria bacterium]